MRVRWGSDWCGMAWLSRPMLVDVDCWTPWYARYRQSFIDRLHVSDYEAFTHPVACMSSPMHTPSHACSCVCCHRPCCRVVSEPRPPGHLRQACQRPRYHRAEAYDV